MYLSTHDKSRDRPPGLLGAQISAKKNRPFGALTALTAPICVWAAEIQDLSFWNPNPPTPPPSKPILFFSFGSRLCV